MGKYGSSAPKFGKYGSSVTTWLLLKKVGSSANFSKKNWLFCEYSYIYSVVTPNLGKKHSVKHTIQIEKCGALKTSIQSDSGVVRKAVLTRWVEV